jgi:hypothetical protein
VCRRRACLSRDEEGLGRAGVGEDEVWRVRGRPLCRRNDADMFGVEMKLDLVQRGDLWLLSKYGVLERGA